MIDRVCFLFKLSHPIPCPELFIGFLILLIHSVPSKAGLYEAKNMGMMPIGHVKRQIQVRGQDLAGSEASMKAKLLRDKLIQIKQSLEAVTEKR